MKKSGITPLIIMCVVYSSIIGKTPMHFSFKGSVRSDHRLATINNPISIGHAQTITQSGSYVLKDNIAFDPTQANAVCILIDADDVVLDMNLKSIYQVDGNMQAGSIGIAVAPHRNNITITNGTIRNMTGDGILVNNGVDLMSISDITVLSCKGIGIFFNGQTGQDRITNGILQNITIQKLGSGVEESINGMVANYADSISFYGISISNSVSGAYPFYGIALSSCNACLFGNCLITNNSSATSAIAGYVFDGCKTIFLQNCVASQNRTTDSATSSTAIGFCFKNSSEILCDNCSAIQNVADQKACGFCFSNCSASAVEGCESHANRSEQGQAVGFDIDGLGGNIFRSCKAAGNKGATQACGFYMANQVHSSIERCLSKSNIGGTGDAYGIALINSINCLLRSNESFFNVGGNTSYGIYTDGGEPLSHLVLSNFAVRNDINFHPAFKISLFKGSPPNKFANITL